MEGKIFDADSAIEWADRLNKGIKAPYVSVYKSKLGGPERTSIMILFSLDKKEDWTNRILENSRYCRMHLMNDGELEQFSGHMPKNFRKCRVKSVEDAISKINKYIEYVDVKANEVFSSRLNRIATSICAEQLGEPGKVIATNQSFWQWEYDSIFRNAKIELELGGRLKLIIIEKHEKTGLGAGTKVSTLADIEIGTVDKPMIGTIKSVLARHSFKTTRGGKPFGMRWTDPDDDQKKPLSEIINMYANPFPSENDKIEFIRDNLHKLDEKELQFVYDLVK